MLRKDNIFFVSQALFAYIFISLYLCYASVMQEKRTTHGQILNENQIVKQMNVDKQRTYTQKHREDLTHFFM